MNETLWKRIKYWRDKYKKTPNGYFVAMMIGEEYASEDSKISKRRRKERREK